MASTGSSLQDAAEVAFESLQSSLRESLKLMQAGSQNAEQGAEKLFNAVVTKGQLIIVGGA